MKRIVSSVAVCAALGLTLLSTHASATIKPNGSLDGVTVTTSALAFSGYGVNFTNHYSAGNGYYVGYIDYGSGQGSSSQVGTSSTTSSWTHYYPGPGSWTAAGHVSSGGFTDLDAVNVNF